MKNIIKIIIGKLTFNNNYYNVFLDRCEIRKCLP